MPNVIGQDAPDLPRRLLEALETGQTIVFPTDTVFGIGGNPWDETVLNRVRTLKKRPIDRPFTLHLPSVDAVERYAVLDERLRVAVSRLLPGPYTLLLPAAPAAPPSSVLAGILGVRVPKHQFFDISLAALDRPLFGTSVNRSGAPPLVDVDEIIERFSGVDLIIVGPVGSSPSSILDLTQDPLRVLRGSPPKDFPAAGLAQEEEGDA